MKNNTISYRDPKDFNHDPKSHIHDIAETGEETLSPEDKGVVLLVYENEGEVVTGLRDDVYGPGWLALIDFKFAE